MNKIKKYYWYVGIPIIALIIGTVVFFDLIASTVHGNPHPQINYLIFVLVTVGVVMIWMQVMRINRDARYIQSYYNAVREQNASEEELREMIAQKKSDTTPVFEIVTGLLGKPVSSVQHAALEAELNRFKTEQSRYLILPQFMGGMMVGLGLLGTFIGLLGALAEIAKLINAFSITNTNDAVGAIRMLVERLTAPMQAMGVAFSASLFGVLGSLIMGVLLVGLRNASGELNSMLESRITYLTEFSDETGNGSTAELSKAVSNLAEQSPILGGLATALDQSERRVRELVQGMVQLTTRIERSERNMNALMETVQQGAQREELVLTTLKDTQEALGTVATRWANATQMEGQIVTLLQDQQTQTAQFFNTITQSNTMQQGLNTRLVDTVTKSQSEQAASTQQLATLNSNLGDLAEGMRVGLQDVAGVQRRGGDQLIETMQGGLGDIAGVQRRELDQITTLLQSGLKDLTGIQRRESDQMLISLQTGLKELAGAQRRAVEDMIREQTTLLTQLTDTITTGQTEQNALIPTMTRVNDTLDTMTTQYQQGLQSILDAQQRNQDKSTREQVASYGQLIAAIEKSAAGQAATATSMNNAMQQMTHELKDVGVSHSQLVNRLELVFEEMGTRQTQLTETMLKAMKDKAAVVS